MKVIAVSQREINHNARQETVDSLDQKMGELLSECGYICVPIPNLRRGGESWFKNLKPGGIILSGGGNIDSSSNRFKMEKAALDYAKQDRVPILGICRGMQMMSIHDGGELIRVSNHVRKRHRLKGMANKEVNSFHDYAIRKCTENYKCIAIAEDGVIEAIKHKVLPWQGWMWHPERELVFEQDDIKRIKLIFD